MSQSSPDGRDPSLSLASLLSALSSVLLVVFLASVLSAVLPPKPIDPQWQLLLAASLVNNATVAVVAALLMAMAAWFNPGNKRLRARSIAFRRWALAASIGFLLLIPLQLFAGQTFYRNYTAKLEKQNSQSSEQLQKLRQAVTSANTPQELQAELSVQFGPNAKLSPTELRTPMPELRQQLLARAQQADKAIMRQIETQSSRKPDQLVKETIRITISALAYGVGFACLAGVLPRRSGLWTTQPGERSS